MKKTATFGGSSSVSPDKANVPRQSVMNLKLKKKQIAMNLMNGMRPSVAGSDLSGLKTTKDGTFTGEAPRVSIKRASVNYAGGGGDIGELQIENDRLQTSVMIMSQKLKMKEDDNAEVLEKLNSEIKQWKDKYKNMKNDNSELEAENERLNKQLNSRGTASLAEVQEMKNMINDLTAERDRYAKENEILSGQNDELKSRLYESQQKLRDTEDKMQAQIDALEEKNTQLQKEMAAMQEKYEAKISHLEN